MILAEGVYTLLNDVIFEVARFAFIAALIILAVFLGGKLRKNHDKKKELANAAMAKEVKAEDVVNESNTDSKTM